jgi:hypothetical protein
VAAPRDARAFGFAPVFARVFDLDAGFGFVFGFVWGRPFFAPRAR